MYNNKNEIAIYPILKEEELRDFERVILELFKFAFSPFVWHIDTDSGAFFGKNTLAYQHGLTYPTPEGAIQIAQKDLDEKKETLNGLINKQLVSDKYQYLLTYLAFHQPVAVIYPNTTKVNYWQCFFRLRLPAYNHYEENGKRKIIDGVLENGSLRIDVTGANKIIGVCYHLPILSKPTFVERRIVQKETDDEANITYTPDFLLNQLMPFYSTPTSIESAIQGDEQQGWQPSYHLKSIYPLVRGALNKEDETEVLS